MLRRATGSDLIGSDISENEEDPSFEVFFPDSTSEVFTGKDADAIIDRGEALAAAENVLIAQLGKLSSSPE